MYGLCISVVLVSGGRGGGREGSVRESDPPTNPGQISGLRLQEQPISKRSTMVLSHVDEPVVGLAASAGGTGPRLQALSIDFCAAGGEPAVQAF